MGYAFVGLLLLVLFINVLMIVIKTIEKGRRNRALNHKRKIYLHQLEIMNYRKDQDNDKKLARQKIRDDFIKMRMVMPAGPRPEVRQIGELPPQ